MGGKENRDVCDEQLLSSVKKSFLAVVEWTCGCIVEST